MFKSKLSVDTDRLMSENANNITNYQHIICSKFASDVASEVVTFAELVECFEDFLISPDLNKHNLGLDVLARVVEMIPVKFLSTKELEFIVQFFCIQVKKHHFYISTTLRGMLALVQNPNISKQSLYNITSTLFNNVIWQTQMQADRRIFYNILQYIVTNRIEDYIPTSSEFLFSVISAVDGERDPRNLLLLFSFLPRLYTSIPLGPLAEDAFEVVSCYFPIDFNSSASESGAVTREDLVAALNPCMLASPEFTTFCISLIQEKLESTMKSAKIDSYNLLIEGCKVWPTVSIVPHVESLWLAIKQDTLPPRDANIADSAVQALRTLLEAMPEPSLKPLLDCVIYSCEEFLCDVQLSMFEPSCRLLFAAMQASLSACNLVFDKLLVILISLLQETEETPQVLVLNKLRIFMKLYLDNNSGFASGGDNWSRLHTELIQCMDGTSKVQEATYLALTLIVSQLDTCSREKLYTYILLHCISEQASPLRFACIKCLQALALTYGDEVQSKIVEKLIYRGEEDELALKLNKFETIGSLAMIQRFHHVLEKQFVSLVMQGPAYRSMTITCLRKLLEEEELLINHSLLHFLFSKSSVLSVLINLNVDGEDLLNSSKIIQILVYAQNSSEQRKVISPLVKQLLHHLNKTQQMVLLESLLSCLWPGVDILTLDEIKCVIIPVALHSPVSTLSQYSSLQLLSSLINKSSDDYLLDLVTQQMQLCPVKQATIAQAYITKALILCGHPLANQWLNKLVVLLDNEEVAQIAVDGFQLIVEESKTFLNKNCHCVVKLLYRQRIFDLVVPQLVSSTKKVQHLKALAYVLQAVPFTVYIHQIVQIVPLLVKSMDMDNERLLITTLGILAVLLSVNNSYLEEHVYTFIPRLLHLSRHSPHMHVRIASLQCLYNSLKYSPILLLNHKQQVLTELVYCLDDKKRLVRREATRTRSKWFILGAPKSDP